ncbi:MAG: hypothetical protein FWH55_10230 [Oscillospiraceae bacterium]|nr:hypothetical protein [Oscillospiraceae bacterium]
MFKYLKILFNSSVMPVTRRRRPHRRPHRQPHRQPRTDGRADDGADDRTDGWQYNVAGKTDRRLMA